MTNTRWVATVLCAFCLIQISSLWAAVVFQSESGGEIRTFDTASGMTAVIGNTMVGTMDGLAVSPNGTLYGIHSAPSSDTDNGSLYTINFSTGEANLVGHSGLIAQGLTCGLDGTLYTMSGGNFYSINPMNANATLLATGFAQLNALTVAPVDVNSAAGTIRRGTIVGAQSTLDGGGTTYVYAIDPETLTQTLVHTVPLVLC